MRWIILLFVATNVFSQDTTTVWNELQLVREELMAVESQISSLQEHSQTLQKTKLSLQTLLLEARVGAEGGFPIVTSESVLLYPSVGTTRSTQGFSHVMAVIKEFEGTRVRVLAEDGTEGWIYIHNIIFLRNPYEYAEEIIQSGVLTNSGEEWLTIVASNFDREKREAAQEKREAAQESARLKSNAEEARRLEAITRDLAAKGIPILVDRFISSINSAGGLEPVLWLSSISKKEIKYVNISARVFNSVGDPAPNRYGDRSNELRLRLVGPIGPNEKDNFYGFSDAPPFYNRTGRCVELREIEVEFMDGTSTKISGFLLKQKINEGAYKTLGECLR